MANRTCPLRVRYGRKRIVAGAKWRHKVVIVVYRKNFNCDCEIKCVIAISPTDADSDNEDEKEVEDYEGMIIFAAVKQLKYLR